MVLLVEYYEFLICGLTQLVLGLSSPTPTITKRLQHCSIIVLKEIYLIAQ